MSAINVLEEISKKYNIEKFDYEWMKTIIEEFIQISEDYEKLEKRNINLCKALAQTIDTINNITKNYFYERKE